MIFTFFFPHIHTQILAKPAPDRPLFKDGPGSRARAGLTHAHMTPRYDARIHDARKGRLYIVVRGAHARGPGETPVCMTRACMTPTCKTPRSDARMHDVCIHDAPGLTPVCMTQACKTRAYTTPRHDARIQDARKGRLYIVVRGAHARGPGETPVCMTRACMTPTCKTPRSDARMHDVCIHDAPGLTPVCMTQACKTRAYTTPRHDARIQDARKGRLYIVVRGARQRPR